MSEPKKAHAEVTKAPESKLKRAGKQFGKYFTAAALTTALTLSPFSVNVGKIFRGNPAVEWKKAFAQDSFAELQQLEKMSDEKIKNGVYTESKFFNGRWFSLNVQIPVPGENWIFHASANIGWDGEKQRNDIIVSVVINGKRGELKIPFDYLAQKYYDITGQKMEGVKLIGRDGWDSQVGNYVQILVYPADINYPLASKGATKESVIKKGYPYMFVSYAGGHLYGDAKDTVLLTSM